MSSKAELAEVLKTAIRAEEDGFRFYDLLVEKADNDDARRKLKRLRDDEMQHKKVLYEMYADLIGGEIGSLPKRGLSVLSEVFRKGQMRNLKTEQEYINLAIEAELAATRYYQDKLQACDDPAFRRVFDRLAAEEHGHYELLMAERESISGNYHWFSYGEGAPLED